MEPALVRRSQGAANEGISAGNSESPAEGRTLTVCSEEEGENELLRGSGKLHRGWGELDKVSCN